MSELSFAARFYQEPCTHEWRIFQIDCSIDPFFERMIVTGKEKRLVFVTVFRRGLDILGIGVDGPEETVNRPGGN